MRKQNEIKSNHFSNSINKLLFVIVFGVSVILAGGCAKGPKGTAETTYHEEDISIAMDGYELPATICIPDGKGSFPAVVMLHGTGSNRNEAGNGYVYASHTLASKYRIASIRIDFPGSDLSDADSTLYSYDPAVEDAVAAAEYISGCENIKSDSIGIMGWSQGGTIALLASGRHPELFKSVVTWAGAPDLMAVGLFSEEDYKEATENGYFIMDFAFRDSVKTSRQWCEDVMSTEVLKEFSEGYRGPVLAIAGTEDTTVDPQQSSDIVAASSNEKSETCFIEGMDHTLNVFSEEDLRSLYQVIDKTGNFFADTLGGIEE